MGRTDNPIRVAITAGFDRSPQAMALLQLLHRDGHVVAGVIVVKALQLKRVKELLLRGGRSALTGAAKRVLGAKRPSGGPISERSERHQLRRDGLAAIARDLGVPLITVDSLNSEAALKPLASRQVDGAVFCGGGILRAPFLEAANGRVLNAHAGPMPEVRGMNAAEWAALLNLRREITIHYIDQGIDTGPIVARHALGPLPSDIETLREQPIAAAIDALSQAVDSLRKPMPEQARDAAAHGQYYTMAPLLRAQLARKLEKDAQ